MSAFRLFNSHAEFSISYTVTKDNNSHTCSIRVTKKGNDDYVLTFYDFLSGKDYSTRKCIRSSKYEYGFEVAYNTVVYYMAQGYKPTHGVIPNRAKSIINKF